MTGEWHTMTTRNNRKHPDTSGQSSVSRFAWNSERQLLRERPVYGGGGTTIWLETITHQLFLRQQTGQYFIYGESHCNNVIIDNTVSCNVQVSWKNKVGTVVKIFFRLYPSGCCLPHKLTSHHKSCWQRDWWWTWMKHLAGIQYRAKTGLHSSLSRRLKMCTLLLTLILSYDRTIKINTFRLQKKVQ